MIATAHWQDDSDMEGAGGSECAHTRRQPPGGRRPVPLTTHARRRTARRNVAPDAVEYVLAHGRKIQRTGVTFYFLGRRDVPATDRGTSWAARLEGTIVLQAPDGTIITVYRNRRGLAAIRRKMKYRLPDLDTWYATETDPLEWEAASA